MLVFFDALIRAAPSVPRQLTARSKPEKLVQICQAAMDDKAAVMRAGPVGSMTGREGGPTHGFRLHAQINLP